MPTLKSPVGRAAEGRRAKFECRSFGADKVRDLSSEIAAHYYRKWLTEGLRSRARLQGLVDKMEERAPGPCARGGRLDNIASRPPWCSGPNVRGRTVFRPKEFCAMRSRSTW